MICHSSDELLRKDSDRHAEREHVGSQPLFRILRTQVYGSLDVVYHYPTSFSVPAAREVVVHASWLATPDSYPALQSLAGSPDLLTRRNLSADPSSVAPVQRSLHSAFGHDADLYGSDRATTSELLRVAQLDTL